MTIEGHAEAGYRVAMASADFTGQIATFATFSGAVAVSTSQDGRGVQGYAAAERTTGSYHVGVSALIATAGYRDIGAFAGDPPPRHMIQASAGLTFGRQGSFGIAYVDISQRGFRDAVTNHLAPAADGPTSQSAVRNGLLSATYSREVMSRIYTYVTAYEDVRAGRGTVMAGLSFRFGGRGAINASYDSSTRQTITEASRPAVDPGEVGWRVYAAQGATDRTIGEVRYHGDHADMGLGIDADGGSTYIQASARGSLAAVGGSVFAANSISDGFAVVDTGGIGDVKVSLNNRPVGTTNGAGKLLVPGLVAYQPSRIAIDPTDLPLDARWDIIETSVAPADRMGSLARFGIRRARSALLSIRLPDGGFLPLGSRLATALGRTVEVGFDGQAYLEDVGDDIDAEATTPNATTCHVHASTPVKADAATLSVVCLPRSA